MGDISSCQNCKSNFAYPTGTSWMCPECGHEWNQDEVDAENAQAVVEDDNGKILNYGDAVVMVKDLAVKGTAQSAQGRHQGEGHPPDGRGPQHRLQDRWVRGDGAEIGVREEGLNKL